MSLPSRLEERGKKERLLQRGKEETTTGAALNEREEQKEELTDILGNVEDGRVDHVQLAQLLVRLQQFLFARIRREVRLQGKQNEEKMEMEME